MMRIVAMISLATTALAACSESDCKPGRCGSCRDANGTWWDVNPWCSPVSDAGPPEPPRDAMCPVIGACNVLFQTGCNLGEKCTWFYDDGTDPCRGDHIGCSPAGDKQIGEACAYGAPGPTGFDDCIGGAVCNDGTCKAICDHQGFNRMCPDGFGCVRVPGLFGPADPTEPPAAGVCEPSCDPIADNDFDGSGSASIKTGTTCSADPAIGCYGNLSSFGVRTHFICAPPATGTETLVHRSVIPAQLQFLNSCHPGYTIAFGADATGSTNVACYAFCVPGNSYAGAPTQEPNGKPGHECRVDSGGRSGNFGTPASATENGEHCMYSWLFEVDGSGAIHRSPTSDTVGICWDHTKYTFDHDGDLATPSIQFPRCAELPLNPATGIGAEDLGCVESALAGHAINRAPIVLPRM